MNSSYFFTLHNYHSQTLIHTYAWIAIHHISHSHEQFCTYHLAWILHHEKKHPHNHSLKGIPCLHPLPCRLLSSWTAFGVLSQRVSKAQSFGRMCSLCKSLKEDSSASSRLRAHRASEDIGGYYVVICKRGELCEQQALCAQILRGNLRKRRALQAAGFVHVILRKRRACNCSWAAARARNAEDTKKKFWKPGRKSSGSARCVPLRSSARARTWFLLKKKIHVYHTKFFLAAGNKLALLVKVWYICIWRYVFGGAGWYIGLLHTQEYQGSPLLHQHSFACPWRDPTVYSYPFICASRTLPSLGGPAQKIWFF